MAEHDDGMSSQHLRLLAEEVVLEAPAVEQVLLEAAIAAAAGAGHSCGITYVTRYGALTVASSDAIANAVDELQYGAGDGPCLEALRTGVPVRVEDNVTETRWGDYPRSAAQAGVHSSLSYPVLLRGRSVGAINLYSASPGPWGADQEAALLLLSDQVGGILDAVRSMADDLVRDPRAAALFAQRHEFDIASGIVMSQHSSTSEHASVLIEAAATRRAAPVSIVVAELLEGGNLGETP